VKGYDARQRFGRTAPAGEREAEGRQPFRRHRAERAEAHDADPAAGCRQRRHVHGPFASRLPVVQALPVAVEMQHRQHHELRHPRGNARLAHAQEHRAGRHAVDEAVDAGAARHDEAQAGHVLKRGRRRRPDHRGVRRADVTTEAQQARARHFLREDLLPQGQQIILDLHGDERAVHG
jgi:hypothetical protein